MKRLFQALAVCFALGAQAQGTFEAITTYATTTPSTLPGTSGWIFSPATNLFVTGLGVFNNALAGQQAVFVGLWTSSGSLLVSNAVTALDPLVNQTRYVAINPVEISAGQQYHLGAFSTEGPLFLDVFGLAPGDTIAMSPLINLVGAANLDTGFGLPTAFPDGEGIVFLGPNFTFAPIPEPSAVALLCLAGLVLALRRKCC